MSPTLRFATVFAVVAVVLLPAGPMSVTADEPATPITVTENDAAEAVESTEDPALDGLRVRLSHADPDAGGEARIPLPETSPLSAAEARRLLDRLPPLPEDPPNPEFALRGRSLPPPRTGETALVSFPAPDEFAPPVPDIDASGPLVVRRYAPEGDVPMVPRLSITFSQPMVSVTSQPEAAASVPVQLEPTPNGRWRWLGTRTALFDPDERFPMATSYVATVPAGTTSATGGVLEQELRFGFRTPALRVLSFTPGGGPQPLDPVLVLEFDQAIDRDALLPFVELRGGGSSFALRIATDAEIAADGAARAVVARVPPERILALRAEQLLPRGTRFMLILRMGAPSAEGPRTTERGHAEGFFTYPPLKIHAHGCSWGAECPPGSDWWVSFNNPIEGASIDRDAFSVDPEVRAFRIDHRGGRIGIGGIKTGRTTYRLTLPASLKDVFGQALGRDQEVAFKVGPARKSLRGPAGPIVVLDPSGDPVLPIYSIGHQKLRLRVFEVEPKDWAPLFTWMRNWWNEREGIGAPPGRRVGHRMVGVQGNLDELTETRLDLAPYLDDGVGQLIVWVEPTVPPGGRWTRQGFVVWVQATNIGLSAAVDSEQMIAWANDLQTGASLEGVELAIDPGSQPATTDANGIAQIDFEEIDLEEGPLVPRALIARNGGDVAILPEAISWWTPYPGWRKIDPTDQLRWFVFDDRGLYQPGETVRVKGWVRWFEPKRGGDIRGIDTRPEAIRWEFAGPQGNDIASGEATLSALGGFDLAIELPDSINLGTAWLQLYAQDPGGNGESHRHPVRVEEFRRPEFEVEASADPGPHVLGGHAVIDVEAAYFAGGGLPAADTTWRVFASPGTFRPPNRDDWSFGRWVPWWRSGPWNPGANVDEAIGSFEAKTDGGGVHRLRIDFEALHPPRPMNVRAEASVMDVNRQSWTGKATLLLHPASVYVGLQTPRTFVQREQDVEISAIAVGIDGTSAPGRAISIRFARLEWETTDGDWKQLEKDVQDCSEISGEEAMSCTFTPSEGGRHRVSATVLDEHGRRNESELTVWVAGGNAKPARGLEQQEVELVPDRESYAPGDTAEILVQAPFHPVEALVTWRRSGIEKAVRLRMEESTTTLRVPIEDAHIPDLTVQVDLVGETTRNDDQGRPLSSAPPRPAYATGSLQLKVPPATRSLSVSVTPAEEELPPGSETSIALQLRDASGAPVPEAEVALLVVDESVLSLTGYQMADPLELFYSLRGAGAVDHRLRGMLLLVDPQSLSVGGGHGAGDDSRAALHEWAASPMREAAMAAPMMDRSDMEFLSESAPMQQSSQGGEAGAEGIALRTKFDALALFEPALRTDAEGRAVVRFSVPDSLTRYRVMAVAVAGGTQFGKGEANITARKPLMLRPSPPRFLNFGDVFELPIVLQNQTADPLDVQVAVRSTGFEMTGVPGVRVRVEAHDRVEVRFPAAARNVGNARFQVAASGAPGGSAGGRSYSDGAQQELPIWTPATTEAFATYGEIDAGAIVQPVRAPDDVWTQFGGLEITTSSTALQALTDAVIQLVDYPFECSEQLSSRILAIAALRDVLSAFEAEGLPEPEELIAQVDADLAKLATRQTSSGAFGFWRRDERRHWPYVTVHVMHSLARAQQKGFTLPEQMLSRGTRYLRDIRNHIPSDYSKESRWALRAYALYVRELLGDTDGPAARALYREAGLEGLSLEGLAWLLPTFEQVGATSEIAVIRRHLENQAVETASAASFTTSYSDGAHVLLHSSRRTDGVVLEALVRVAPDSDLIPKVVRGLLAHRKRGHWGSTQENAFVLLALDRYFGVFEAETPDFVARAWLGEDYAGDHAFRGRTTERAYTQVPMDVLAARPPGDRLVLQKDGAGRMYYRIGLRYAPKSLESKPVDHGFAVERSYSAVDDEADVRRDEDGTWRFKAGARIRVTVTMVAEARRYHVALVDPLPAGLEPINPELATSETLPPAETDAASSEVGGRGRFRSWWGPWYEHDNLRDERAEAFTSLLWDGVYEYTYVARATTPGTFVVPPPKAEEMYTPETFGRGATDRVVIE